MSSTFIYLLCFLFLMTSFALVARFAARFGIETHRGEEAERARHKMLAINSCSAAAIFFAGLWWFFFRRNPEPIAASHIVLVLPLGLHCVAVWLRTTRFAPAPLALSSTTQEGEGAAPVESALNRLLGEGGAKATNYVKPEAVRWGQPLNTLWFISCQMTFAAGIFGRALEEGRFELGGYLFAFLAFNYTLVDKRLLSGKTPLTSVFLFLLVCGGVAAGLTYLLWPIVATG